MFRDNILREVRIMHSNQILKIVLNSDNTGATGTVIAAITHRIRKGMFDISYGILNDANFHLTLDFEVFADHSDPDRPYMKYERFELVEALLRDDSANHGEYVDYTLGEKDQAAIIPALNRAILNKMLQNDSVNPETIALLTMPLIDPSVSGTVIDNEHENSDICLNDTDGYGSLVFVTPDNIQFTAHFKASYEEQYQRAIYEDGILIKPKIDRLINMNITALSFSDFTDLSTDNFETIEVKMNNEMIHFVESLILEYIKESTT